METGRPAPSIDPEVLLTLHSTLEAMRINVIARMDDSDSFDTEIAVSRDHRILRDIDAAIARIDAGTYGSCERCERDITVERLEVVPETRTCVTCPNDTGPLFE